LNTVGSVVGRQAHLPFGEDFAESGTQQKQHFTSYERDSESGTDYAVNRYYSASTGRFQSADPFEPSANTSAPQSWNRYVYTMNAPTDFIDPGGLSFAFIEFPDPCSGEPIDWIHWVAAVLHVEQECQRVIYKPESPANAAWRRAEPEQTADAVATPKGIVKLPNGCECTVRCGDGKDYEIVCKCKFDLLSKGRPRVLNPGEEFADPRKEGVDWIPANSLYSRHHLWQFKEWVFN
jgi:RHS repeat-associated protein